MYIKKIIRILNDFKILKKYINNDNKNLYSKILVFNTIKADNIAFSIEFI